MAGRTPAIRARQVWRSSPSEKDIADGAPDRAVYDYRVESTKNLLDVQVGETLTRPQVQALIDLGVDVSVTGAS